MECCLPGSQVFRATSAALAVCCAAAVVLAQPPERSFQESVSLNTDSTVVKRLGMVQDYLAEERWDDAVELLQDLAGTAGDVLVPVEPGRYISTSLYCNLVLANLPPQGLVAYRARVDPHARQWLDEGRARGDDALLLRVVDRAFASSYGDDALLLLGQQAWDDRSLGLARHRWQQILPPEERAAAGEPLAELRYPDTDLSLAEVHARLVLCSLLEGDVDRAARERSAFGESNPDAEGTLAGRTGRLAEILDAVAAEAREWGVPPLGAGTQTFALNLERNQVLPAGVDVGAPVWSVDLPKAVFTNSQARLALHEAGPLTCYPVVHGDMLLVSDGTRLYAMNLKTGRPWYEIARPDGGTDGALPRDALLYEPAVEPPLPIQPAVGVPRYTLTLHEGRVYAKLGSPVTGRSARELRALPSDLVCFDPLLDEGRLLWRVPASELGEGWTFEGSPVVADGRVFAVIRRRQPQTQINVACFEADTGRLLWNRNVGAVVGDIDEGQNLITHLLLTLAEESLYLSTDVGAIAALEPRDGHLRWVATYESHAFDENEKHSRRQGLTPCLYYRGRIIVAPNDSDLVMALDAEDGRFLWRTALPDGVRHILGAADDRVVLGGSRLWALNVDRGEIVWVSANHGGDPEADGYGRGLLAGDEVYWPKRGSIDIRDQRTGRPVDVIDLRTRGSAGGNLLIAGDRLVVAEPDRLIVFGQESGTLQRPRQLVDAGGALH